MSTRCTIIAKTEDGYAGIYCHSDGYPQYVGRILFEHYNDPAKVKELIALGDISSLGERINPVGPHSFDKREKGTTVAYMRDRGEKGCEARIGHSVKSVSSNTGIDYVFDGKEWSCNGRTIPNAIAGLDDDEA